MASCGFVEATLKHAGEVYEHRMRMQSAGIDLSMVIAATCHYLGIEEKGLARRFNVDRSAIIRARQRIIKNPELLSATKSKQ